MGYKVGIVGATGLVGMTFLRVLEEREFPIDELYLFASARSAGRSIEYRGKNYVVEELKETSFDREMDYALFSAGGEISKRYSPIAARMSGSYRQQQCFQDGGGCTLNSARGKPRGGFISQKYHSKPKLLYNPGSGSPKGYR